MEKLDPLYMYIHIPRTGGTTIESSISKWNSRENNQFLKHYHYVQNWTEEFYDRDLIPKLNNRTRDQQKELKILTGHSIFCNSHKWLKVRRKPYIWSIVRNPIERILSSFNMRYTRATMCQDPSAFAAQSPVMDEWAIRQNKTAADYDTLWEFYQDTQFETNMQCKWLIKSFVKHDGTTWHRHPTYVFGPDTGVAPQHAIPMTWPEWMFHPTDDMKDVNWYKFAENFFPEIWWLTVTEKLNRDLPDFCEHVGLECELTRSNESLLKYWSLDDVMKQPDIQNLIEAEKYDFELHEAAKQWVRPF